MAEKRESNTGLIITLVFFVLATLGLGVATYYGFAEQTSLRDARKKAEDDLKKMTSKTQFNQFQSALYWAYIANENPVGKAEELKSMYEDYKGEQSAWAKDMKSDPEFEKVRARITKMEGLPPVNTGRGALTLRINPSTGAPQSNFTDLLTAERNEERRLITALDNMKKEKDAADLAKKLAEDNAASATAAAKDDYLKKGSILAGDFSKYKQELDEKRKLIDPDTLLKEVADAKIKEIEESYQLKESENKKQQNRLQSQITKLQSELSLLKKGTSEARLEGKPNGHVAEIAGTGANVYIDLGSVADVRPGDLFSIYGIGNSGQPLADPKGKLEVTAVVGDNMAKARLVDVKDRNTDPVMKGDFIFNPIWAPQMRARPENRKHVAVVGIPKIFSRSKDPWKDFARVMEERNVIIDAYIDFNSMTVKPNGKEGISVKTDYLILGEDPLDNKIDQRKYKVLRDEIQAECDRYRVEPIKLDRFLEVIGVIPN